MTLAEMTAEELKDKGFAVEIHKDTVYVGLSSRRVSFMEVEMAMDERVSRSWMRRIRYPNGHSIVAIDL